MNNKEIVITKHAMEQFFKRVYDDEKTERTIRKRIQTIVKRGNIVDQRPGNACEIEYENISLVCVIKTHQITVITCLGDSKYREWVRKNEICPRYKPRKVC